jgi:hypothetical protein
MYTAPHQTVPNPRSPSPQKNYLEQKFNAQNPESHPLKKLRHTTRCTPNRNSRQTPSKKHKT